MSDSTFVKHTSDRSFATDVLEGRGLQVVDFWAEWCGPCKALSPTLEALAEHYGGAVDVQKLNVDLNPEIASTYGIRGIPTLLFFRDGQLVDRIVGAVPRESLQQSIDKHLT